MKLDGFWVLWLALVTKSLLMLYWGSGWLAFTINGRIFVADRDRLYKEHLHH